MQAPYARTSYELLLEIAAKAPGRPLVLTADGAATYAEMATRAARIAGHLRARGIGRGDRLGLLCNNRVAWLEVMFGAGAVGATVVPFSTWSTAAELDYLLADSEVRCLFALPVLGERHFAADIAALRDSGRLPRLQWTALIDSAPRAGFESYADCCAAEPLPPMPPGHGASASDSVLIHYTSGSSSRPKAVPILQFAAIENAFNIGERQGLTAHDRVFLPAPLFWAYGAVNALFATLTHGATLVLQGRFEPGEALDLIERHACTAIYTLPAMTNAMLAHPSFDRQRTKHLTKGVSIGTPQDIVRAARELGVSRICNIYGSTEGHGNSCVTPHDWPLSERAACQGPPLPGVTFRIRDAESGALLGSDTVGEVEISGYLTPGYCGASARNNAEVMTADGFFRTGDLGALDARGAFVFAGRTSEMIKRSGINVSPSEIEDVLLQHADVALAAVTGLDDAARGEIIVAYVVPRPDVTPSREGVLSHCRERLSRYKLPDRLHFVESLPLTVTGKLMRRELKAQAAADETREAVP